MRYPILRGKDDVERGKPYPVAFPLALLLPHAAQAEGNHGQTLEHLASRGGLSPAEIWCVMHDRNLRAIYTLEITGEKAVEWLRTIDGVVWF